MDHVLPDLVANEATRSRMRFLLLFDDYALGIVSVTLVDARDAGATYVHYFPRLVVLDPCSEETIQSATIRDI